MKKKLITLLGTTVLSIAMATTAFAAAPSTREKTTAAAPIQATEKSEFSGCGSGKTNAQGFMYNKDGDLLSQKEFENKLDKAIKDGTIKSEDKNFYVNMHKNCVSGTGMRSGSGRGCGRR